MLSCRNPSEPSRTAAEAGGGGASPATMRRSRWQGQPVRLSVQEALWLLMSRRSASCCPQLVSMSKRSAALEGRLRETSAREGQLRSALQHTAAGGAAPAASHVANGGCPVSSMACVPTPLLHMCIQQQSWAACGYQNLTYWHLHGSQAQRRAARLRSPLAALPAQRQRRWTWPRTRRTRCPSSLLVHLPSAPAWLGTDRQLCPSRAIDSCAACMHVCRLRRCAGAAAAASHLVVWHGLLILWRSKQHQSSSQMAV